MVDMVPKQARQRGGKGLGNKALTAGQKQVRNFFLSGIGVTVRSSRNPRGR